MRFPEEYVFSIMDSLVIRGTMRPKDLKTRIFLDGGDPEEIKNFDTI